MLFRSSNVNLDAVKWESGNLVFTNAPISDVINAIETRYGKQIQETTTIQNSNNGNTVTQNKELQFTGVFKNTDELSTVIKTIEIALGLQLEVK